MAAMRTGQFPFRAACTMACILLPRPEMRMTILFMARIVHDDLRAFRAQLTGQSPENLTGMNRKPGKALSFQPRNPLRHETHRAGFHAPRGQTSGCWEAAPRQQEIRTVDLPCTRGW